MEQILQMYDTPSEEEDDDVVQPSPTVIAASKANNLSIVAAPSVDTSTSELHVAQYHDPSTTELSHNPRADFLFAPVQGPLPSRNQSAAQRAATFGPTKNALLGHVELDSFDEHTFNEQYHTYQSFGYALDPSKGVTTAWHEQSNANDVDALKARMDEDPKFRSRMRRGGGAGLDLDNSGPDGIAKNSNAYIGNKSNLQENLTMTVFNQSNAMSQEKRRKSRKRKNCNDAGDIEGYQGPWATRVKTDEEEAKWQEELAQRKREWDETHPGHEEKQQAKRRRLDREYTDKFNGTESAPTESNNNSNNSNSSSSSSSNNNNNSNSSSSSNRNNNERVVDTQDKDAENEADLEELRNKRKEWYKEQEKGESTQFHGDEFRDYQGRTYMYCPPERRAVDAVEERKYYVPKKRVHTWVGHKAGVNQIKFSKDGHILLSCSNDGCIKIWNVYDNRECLRTMKGHNKGVRYMSLTRDGTKVLTSSFDRWIKLWDVETGKVIWRGSSGKVAFSPCLYPGNENEFVAGQKNKIAVQWDMRANKIVQVYDEHLSCVNSITFIDGNRRFVTTSDDKKIFVWEYGTPVVIKHVSDPSLHSVPFMMLHPNEKYVLGQSMDNQIVVYSADSRFRLNPKKHFKGHLSAGYACQVDVSYDGRFVMSGDAQGKLYFWDWQKSRFEGKIKAHNKVTMGCIWHPVMTSKVATCSWDGLIKLWD